MRSIAQRVAALLRYRRGMGVARRHMHVTPVPRPAALNEYPGEWVAVLDGVVIAHSPSSREVVRQLNQLGSSAREAVLHRSAVASEAVAVGLG